MTHRPLTLLVSAVLMAGALSCSRPESTLPMAGEAAVGDAAVTLTDFHARPSPPGVSVGAIFGTIQSGGGDTLIAVSVPATVAGRAEIHRMVQNAAGQMEMHAVPWLALPEDAPVELAPGGMHVMLFDLVGPLVAGEKLTLTLRFRTGGERLLEVPVRED